jgi:hypothetical protein
MTQNQEIVDQSLANARALMNHLHDTHDYPIDSLMACVLAIATLAHGVGMPLDTLVDGVTRAYDDLKTAKKDIMQ